MGPGYKNMDYSDDETRHTLALTDLFLILFCPSDGYLPIVYLPKKQIKQTLI